MHPFLLNTVSGTTLVNSDVYVYMWAPPYGWWNQGETFGSQNGLTFMYKVVNLQTGVWGPSKASLANNIWPSTYQQSIVSNDWPGVGGDKWSTPYDINWNVDPLNSSTGYIGFTFGSTGHIGYTSVFEIVRSHSWIPFQHRVFDPNRHYRAVAARGSGLTNSELIENIPNAYWQPMPTPWIKRKMNFVRKELQNISLLMGNCGFYMSSASLDDEYYIYGDYSGLGTSSGDTRFYNFYMYPGNTSGGFTWFASYTGSSAAPDSLIQRGITSFRAFLLSHGFTTNSNSSKFVDGLTAIRQGTLANNIAAAGSVWQTLGLEYKSAVADWVALHFQDYIEDFKRYNGLTSENNKIANYGYYRTDVAVQGYTSDRWGATYSGLLKQLSSDFIPYPDATPSSNASNARKSAYYGYNVLSSGNGGGYVQREIVGDLDSIHCYGAIANYLSIWRSTAFVHSLDRGKFIFGNSYGYGLSQGINFQYYWQYPDSALQAPRWYVPANYLNSGLPGQTFSASKCYELFGITASMRYDPTGSLGSTRGNATRCAGNSAPQFISWHLNPVWGITQIGTADNYNPANYLPLKGKHMTLGISCGSISLEQLNITRVANPGAIWTKDYFDPSGFPIPGNTLPAGSLYNQYWTHWYPMAFMALMYDVYWGRQVAANNVYRALGQQEGVVPTVPGSVWNYAQKPIETWITDQKISGGDLTTSSSYEATGNTYILEYNTFVPTGLTFGYFLSTSQGAVGTTQIVGEQGPMFYEHMRHQYLHKTIRYLDWNIPMYTCTTSATGGQVTVGNVGLPFRIGGITSFGVCGAITMALARKVNTVVGECNTRAGGLVNQTVFLAPGNMAERSYLMSGAQKAGGGFLWRITFANPATYPIISVRGSLTGITTEYRVAGITDYINNANSKFGIWWETSALEVPVVDNPPTTECLRLGIVNLPENPKIEYDATQMATSRNLINSYFVNNNPDVFVNMNSPYGWAFQQEQWGSQNGLTRMWPFVIYTAPGYFGPSRACLAGGSYGIAYGPWGPGGAIAGRGLPLTEEWYGIGEPISNGDINWAASPWNTPTGYIGLTFGSTGFVSTGYIDKWASGYTWIPNKYRTFQPSRSWRAINNESNAIEGLEKTTYLRSDSELESHNTPWLKRKMNFVRAELSTVYKRLKSQGFTCAHFDLDDEYYSYFNDLRNWGKTGGICGATSSTYFSGWTGAGNTYVYNTFIYPTNIASGVSWYASFSGQSAAPDSLVASGITSMRGLFLERGFTTTVGNLRFVDGFTAMGGAGVCGNIALSGSAFQFFALEYYSVLKDWLAYMWTDMVNDWKNETGIVADNSLAGDYSYYSTTGALFNYYKPGWTSAYVGRYVSNVSKSSSSVVPWVSNPSRDGDERVTKYYAYNQTIGLGGPPNASSGPLAYQTQVGDIGVIHPYGSVQLDITSNVYSVLDRNNEYIGTSYGNSVSGVTNSINTIAYYVLQNAFYNNYTPRPSFMYDSRQARKWFPQGIFNIPNLPPQGATLTCLSCAETLGQTGFLRYDPTGANGSCSANPLKVATDRAPHYVSWFLNPVWGINLERLSNNSNLGPANYVPQRGLEIRDGLTMASVTTRRTGNATSLSTDNFDACGNPYPGNTLPAGTIYNHYWTHWYPLGFMALLGDVKWGRGLATTNVSKASFERENPNSAPRQAGTLWFGVQKPIASWIASQLWVSDFNEKGRLDVSNNQPLGSYYYVPRGLTFNYYLCASELVGSTYQGTARGITYIYGENGPMAYENIRHQYINKTNRFAYWNPGDHCYITSESNTPIHCTSGQWPLYYPPQAVLSNPRTPNRGITGLGVCGAIRMQLARKINKVVDECQTLGKGIVYETISLDPVNMDERSYIASGAQLVDGSYLWRITFAHPVTQTPIIIRGSVTGVTTAYNVNGVTDYINIPNSKFGVWWSSNYYETPIVENPPVSEAERLNVLNLPTKPAFVYDPFTMEEADLIPSTTKDLFYTPNAYSTEGIQTDTVAWFGQRRETIATFQGIPYQGNIGALPDTKGRPYAFEYNPVNPTTSSPWHNVVYELAIDPYKWGMRSFLMYWPFGSIPSYNYPMRYLDLWDQGYFTSTTDASRSPARIRGFTSAIKNLLEGKLTPSGFSAINEPCNVMIYLMGANGFDECRWGVTSGSTYYPGSMNFWDRCYATAGSTVGANNLYYSYIDRMVEDIVSMNRGVTSGKLSVGVDSAAVAANPGTIGLFADLRAPYTRGASYELGDWYFVQKLKDNNIPTYIEARPAKQYSLSFCGITTGPNKTLVPGYCGATAMSLWRNHLSVEYTLWRTNPRFADQEAFLSRFVPDNEVSTVWRWVQNSGPLGASFDPYKVPMTVFTQGASWTITFDNGLTTYLYTPHQALFNLYAASDVYRKHMNYSGNTFSGIVYDYFTKGIIIEYSTFSRGSCGNREVNPTNNTSSLTGYYRVNTDNAFEGNRIGYGKERGFCASSFIANPVSYGTQAGANNSVPGWWQQSGMSFWRQSVKQASFTGFVQMLNDFSSQAVPSGGNSAGWDGNVYPFDSYSKGIIPLSMRLPERTPIYAFAWTWASESAGTPVYYVSGITQNWIPSSNDLTDTTVWTTPSGGFSVYSASNEISGPPGMSAFGVTFTGSGSKFGNQRYTYSNFVTAGITYTFSFYLNVSQGLTQNLNARIGDHFGINLGACYSPRLEQILPVSGSVTTNNSSYVIQYGFGLTGWTRFAINVTPQLNQRLQIASFQVNGSFATAQTKPYYIAGVNFNEGSTPTDFISTNIVPEIEPNQYGNTGQSVVYDGTISSYLNFGASYGLTYIQPLADAYGTLNTRKSWLSPTSKIKWRESQSLKRYVSVMKGLRSGKRGIYPRFMSSPWLWALEDDKFALGATGGLALTFYDNDGNEISRPLCGNTYHGGLWIVNGICLGQNIWNQVLVDLSSQNAKCDYFIHNQELVNGYFSAFSIFDCTGNSMSVRNAIINNPKYNQEFFGLTSWASYMASKGACAYTIQNTVYDPALSYLAWDNYGQALFRKSMDVMVSGYDTYDNGRFNETIQTDAYSFSGDGAINDGAPSIFGFHPVNSMYVMGNAPSPILYGWYYSGWDTSVIYGTNMDKIKFSLSVGSGETRPSKYPIAWMPFLFDLQSLRLAKRGSPNLPMVPVIPSLRFVGNAPGLPGQTSSDLTKTFAQGVTAAEPASWYADVKVGFNPQCGITFTQSGGNSAYFYELIRHACLTGVIGFDWWNNSSFWHAQAYGACYGNTFIVMKPPTDYVAYMKTGNTTYLQDMRYLNDVLDDCNTKIGGYSPISYLTNRINYTSNYVISGAPGRTGGAVWRVTVKPGLTLLANGITLSSGIGRIGTWINTPGPTLTGIGLTFI
jgi:hypothetical protein